MDESVLRQALINTPVSRIRAFDTIGSTNDEALRWVEEGAPDFALVIADEQTKGRGRFNRLWITRPEASLAFSVICNPNAQEQTYSGNLFAPMCGLAVWQTLANTLGLEPLIKWPNDVLLDRQKCCGILVESIWAGTQCKGIVMGIGINIAPDSLPPDANSLFPATWIEKYTKQQVDRFALLANILSALQIWRNHLGRPDFFETWQNHLAFRGETVRIVENENTSIIGIEEGIDAAGNLVLLDETGSKKIIEVGDVHLRPENQ
jgi:BirA family transcriptional regulator, biotin operon repressor / biotin---[acetyl-CoA-carboxylase] ligase